MITIKFGKSSETMILQAPATGAKTSELPNTQLFRPCLVRKTTIYNQLSNVSVGRAAPRHRSCNLSYTLTDKVSLDRTSLSAAPKTARDGSFIINLSTQCDPICSSRILHFRNRIITAAFSFTLQTNIFSNKLH